MKPLRTRLDRLERMSGAGPKMPILYLFISGDSDDGSAYGDDTVIGFVSGSEKITRRPGETLEDLQGRLDGAYPGGGVFLAVYRDRSNSFEQFNKATEIGSQL